MKVSEFLSKNASLLLGGLGLAAAAIGSFFRFRRRKTDAERERERRLAVNAVGRMTDGTLTEPVVPADSRNSLLVCYRYSVSGVEYSAAQDISDLQNAVTQRAYLPGEPVIIKYDQQNPFNSIVVCEQWSGLAVGGHQSRAQRRGGISLTGT